MSANLARPKRIAVAAAVAAGAGDLATGLVLVASPATVERALSLAPSAAPAAIFLRWIGVFVGAVGIAYLSPWRVGEAVERWRRLRFAIEATAVVRGLVAIFVTGAVGVGALAPNWLVVAVWDGAVGATQLVLLARGGFGREI